MILSILKTNENTSQSNFIGIQFFIILIKDRILDTSSLMFFIVFFIAKNFNNLKK